jgi:hypothetical protein
MPSSVVKDTDPVVESAIMRCLQKNPALRPSSVRQVAAAFPGGDRWPLRSRQPSTETHWRRSLYQGYLGEQDPATCCGWNTNREELASELCG